MDPTLGGKVYFRPLRNATKKRQLEVLAYTAAESRVNYHQRLLGARHLCLRKHFKKKHVPIFSHVDHNQPRSLYSLCVDFVAYNLDIVDSFLGLPSLIGEEIFKACLANEQFAFDHYEYDAVTKRVGLFFEAYSGEMLDSINLSGEWKFMACYLDQISLLMPFVTTIELCHCKIGNKHDILYELGKLHAVKNINLNDNEIGDEGIRNLLQTHRRARCGLENLEVLQLLRNFQLTNKFLPHISTLPKLKVIFFSSKEVLDESLKRYQFSRMCPAGFDHTVNGNETSVVKSCLGWGNALIKHWIEVFKSSELDKQLVKEQREAGYVRTAFYKKNEKEHIAKALNDPTKLLDQNAYHFYALCRCGSTKIKPHVFHKRKRPTPKENGCLNIAKRTRCDGPLSEQSPNDPEFDALFELYR